jgi:hypothetical protein
MGLEEKGSGLTLHAPDAASAGAPAAWVMLAVMATLRAVAGVKQAHLLMGPTDCIAYVETDTLESLGDTVVALRSVNGVVSTDTRIAMPVL